MESVFQFQLGLLMQNGEDIKIRTLRSKLQVMLFTLMRSKFSIGLSKILVDCVYGLLAKVSCNITL